MTELHENHLLTHLAYHETGHVVALHHFEKTVESVSIYITPTHQGGKTTPTEWPKKDEDRCIVYLGAVIAERICLEGSLPVGCNEDYEKFYRRCNQERDKDITLSYEKKARQVMHRYELLIHEIAGELFIKKCLTREQIEAFF